VPVDDLTSNPVVFELVIPYCLRNPVQALSIRKLIGHLAVEWFNVTMLPGTAMLDAQRHAPPSIQPLTE
jgi:hypothetical protein